MPRMPVLPELFAMVAGDHDDSVVEQPARRQVALQQFRPRSRFPRPPTGTG